MSESTRWHLRRLDLVSSAKMLRTLWRAVRFAAATWLSFIVLSHHYYIVGWQPGARADGSGRLTIRSLATLIFSSPKSSALILNLHFALLIEASCLFWLKRMPCSLPCLAASSVLVPRSTQSWHVPWHRASLLPPFELQATEGRTYRICRVCTGHLGQLFIYVFIASMPSDSWRSLLPAKAQTSWLGKCWAIQESCLAARQDERWESDRSLCPELWSAVWICQPWPAFG